MDLPLSSNYKDVQVFHWILDLACDFSQRQLSGSALLFCQSSCFPSNCDVVTSESNAFIGKYSFNSPHIDHEGSKTTADGLDAICNHYQTFILDCHSLDIEACYFHRFPQENLELDSHSHNNSTTDIDPLSDFGGSNQNINLRIHEGTINKYLNIFQKLKNGALKRPLEFCVEKSCLRISIPHSCVPHNQKRDLFLVQIMYKTRGEGPCLTWTKDQNMQ